MRSRFAATLAVVIGAASGCDSPGTTASSPGVVERDSAGIRVVENIAPVWQEDFWTVDPEPEFVLGGELGEDGGVSLLIWDIVAGAALSDGRVVLLSPRGEQKVLVFEPSGVLSAAFSRAGRGPGEFSHPEHLQVLPGDTIVVWDYMFGPVSYFDASGTLLRHRSLDLGRLLEATQGPGRSAGESVHAPLPDGSFLIQVHRTDWRMPEEGDVYREPVGYVRIDSGYGVHTLGWWKGFEFLNHAVPILPFAVQSLIAGGGDPLTVHVTNGDRFEVHQFTAGGVTPRRIVRRATARTEIESAATRHLAELNGDLDRDWQAWERAVAAAPQRFYPAIGSMRVDAQGYLWVLAQSGHRADRAVTWHWNVFDEGRWLGNVAVPEGVLWIGDNLVLCRHVDRDTGLERVVGYRLSRSAASMGGAVR